jgi:nucleoside-diphosphate-sugar epimerase
MMSGPKSGIYVLGANGFVGKEVVNEARRRGVQVKALVRDLARAGELAAAGAQLIQGDASRPEEWIHEVAQSEVLIDLVQPQLPERIGRKDIRKIAETRVKIMAKLLAALVTIPPPDRPLLMAASGLDDLTPDEAGRVHDDSPPRRKPAGFAHIGIPVRRLIEQSGVAWTFAYLATVYGPGKGFAKQIFPQIAAGRFRMPGGGNNQMPLVHVEDAARALVHLTALPAARLAGRSFVIADGSTSTMAKFAGYAAELLGAPPPRTVPAWLARLVLGRVLFETFTRDISADPAGLLSLGFEFRYPSYVEGFPPSLNQLGYRTLERRQHPVPEKHVRRFPFWLLSVVTAGALLAENLLDFPFSLPGMRRLAGGLSILDMRPWYSGHAAYQLFDALGATGRSTYLHFLWSVDLCMPLLFALFLSVAIKRGAFRRLGWVPLLAAASDYAENVAITVLLLHYPDRLPTVVALSSALTSLKHAGYLSSVFIVIAGFLVQNWKRINSNGAERSANIKPTGTHLPPID